MNRKRESLQYIWCMLKPYKKRLIVLLTLMGVIALGNLIIPLLQQQIVDLGIEKRDFTVLLELVLLAIGLYVSIALLSYIQNRIQIGINYDFQQELQVSAIRHLLNLKMEILRKEGILKLARDVEFFVENLSQVMSTSVLLLLIELFKMTGVVIALFLISWKLALYSLMFIPIRLLISAVFSCRVQYYAKENIKNHQVMHRWEEDVYGTIPEIKNFNIQERKISEYHGIMNALMCAVKKYNLLNGKNMFSGEGLAQAMYHFLYLLAGIMIWHDTLTIGGLLVIATYFMFIINPIDLFSSIALSFENIEPSIERYKSFMALPEEQMNSLVSKEDHVENSNLEIFDVSYSYGTNKVLQHVDARLEYGRKYAIVGENGSGKSTLINLILQFLEVQSGLIQINGMNITELSVADLREYYGVVMQQPNLFNATVADNITVFGKYPLNPAYMNHPLFSFVSELPDGMNTEVGNQSSNLSGGEKQKIALARALMKEPQLLILDEPTSNYDLESKQLFCDLISKLSCTVLVVSHEPDILKAVDEIVIIEDGHARFVNNTEEPEYELYHFKDND